MKLYCPQSMSFHGERAIEFLNFEPYNIKTDKNKSALFWLYSIEDYKFLYLHEGKSYVFWHGIDVLFLYQNRKKLLPVIRKRKPCMCLPQRITAKLSC